MLSVPICSSKVSACEDPVLAVASDLIELKKTYNADHSQRSIPRTLEEVIERFLARLAK